MDTDRFRTECSLLNRFTNEIRYPHRIEINEEDVTYSLVAVEKIRNFEPIQNLRNSITQENNVNKTNIEEDNK